MKRLVLLLPLCAAFAAARADVVYGSDGKPLAGHSAHGDAWNEGPRQAAVLIAGTGDVKFDVSLKSDDARRFFNQGVGQLHGFWFFEAERSFRQVAKMEPECAMAYWGMAMANFSQPKRGQDFIKKAVAMRDKATKREQLYIDALNGYLGDLKKDERQRRGELVKALERLSFEFPDDIEAKALLCYHIWENSQHGIPIAGRQAVDALAQQVLAATPMHPAHHYIIHLWNFEDDRRALGSASKCGQSAPGVAHMWHMPGHTYTKLLRYADAAWQQEASARVDHAHMAAARLMPEQIHNYAHNNDWLVENLGFIGRVRDAAELAKNMIELPRISPGKLPIGRDASRYDAPKTGADMGRSRLLSLALDYELWPMLTELDGTLYLAPAADPVDEARRLRALATAWYRRNNVAKGDEKLAAMEIELKKAREARFTAAEEAEKKAKADKKSKEDAAKAMVEAMQGFTDRIEKTGSLIAEARLYQAIAQAKPVEAKQILDAAKDVPPVRRARVQLQLEQHEQAEKSAREAVKNGDGQVLPLAVLADVLAKCGKRDEAVETFKKLRELCAQADIGEPVFSRLLPLAKEAGFPEDWRPKYEQPKDTGVRPVLANLGQFRWSPYHAPEFSLSDQQGAQHGLHSYEGRPVLVVFYLGSGCPHCIEQLNLLKPLVPKYREAGIDIVAISTENADELHKTFALAKGPDGFPFTILADPTLGAFKGYRCHDDFEEKPLHGTFLIDQGGAVRWQDISHEPFRDLEWLLGEGKRLLGLGQSAAKTAGP